MQPPPDPSKQYISFHAIVIFILSAIQAISGFGLTVIHGYKSTIQTIKNVNGSSNHTPEETDRPSTSTTPPTPPPTAVASKRLSNTSSLFSVSSQQQGSSERDPSADTYTPHFLCYAEPPLVMVTTVFNLNKRYAASAIANTLDTLTSFFMPFLDKLCPALFRHTILS